MWRYVEKLFLPSMELQRIRPLWRHHDRKRTSLFAPFKAKNTCVSRLYPLYLLYLGIENIPLLELKCVVNPTSDQQFILSPMPPDNLVALGRFQLSRPQSVCLFRIVKLILLRPLSHDYIMGHVIAYRSCLPLRANQKKF